MWVAWTLDTNWTGVETSKVSKAEKLGTAYIGRYCMSVWSPGRWTGTGTHARYRTEVQCRTVGLLDLLGQTRGRRQVGRTNTEYHSRAPTAEEKGGDSGAKQEQARIGKGKASPSLLGQLSREA